jgi:hypothetical protein
MGGVLAMIAHLYEVEKVARQKELRGEDLRVARHRTRSRFPPRRIIIC